MHSTLRRSTETPQWVVELVACRARTVPKCADAIE